MSKIPDSGDPALRLPHERRALAHREHYHGRATATPAWSVKARIKRLDRHGYRIRTLCGFVAPSGDACPASLGEGSRPDGINPDWAGYGRCLVENETYGPRQGGRSGEWTLTAPKEFPGFERVPAGSFRVIRRGKERTLDGTPVRRWTGRRGPPNVLQSGGMPLTEEDRLGGFQGVVGWWAELPAVVECPLCGRKNLIEEPSID